MALCCQNIRCTNTMDQLETHVHCDYSTICSRCVWWLVDTCSGSDGGLLPSDKKPFVEPWLKKIYITILRHHATMSQRKKSCWIPFTLVKGIQHDWFLKIDSGNEPSTTFLQKLLPFMNASGYSKWWRVLSLKSWSSQLIFRVSRRHESTAEAHYQLFHWLHSVEGHYFHEKSVQLPELYRCSN